MSLQKTNFLSYDSEKTFRWLLASGAAKLGGSLSLSA